jgi:hypothetical protein
MVAIHHDKGGVKKTEGKKFSEPTNREMVAWLAVRLPAEISRQVQEALNPIREIKKI